jgi:adenylate cyclase
MSERTQRRLAAIVSADVVGYSRLMGADEVGTHARLKARYTELVEPRITQHGGRIVKLMGDGLLAEFQSVVDAVQWAIEMQAKVAELDTGVNTDQRIEYRVGINLGDVIVDGDDIFGDGVNVAARLQEIAESGGVCISEKVHAEVRGKLGTEFADGGAQAMKNIAEPIHVWRWSPQQQAPAQAVDAGPDEPLALSDKPSIAVLPFDNMSGDPEQEYFADGMTEDIITALSRFHSLFVISRNSSFAYKGTSPDVRGRQ